MIILPLQSLNIPFQFPEGLCILHIDSLRLPLRPPQLGLKIIVLILSLADLLLHLSEHQVETLLETEQLGDDLVGPQVVPPRHLLQDGEEGFDLLDDERVGRARERLALPAGSIQAEGRRSQGGICTVGRGVDPLGVLEMFVVHKYYRKLAKPLP